MPCGAGQVGRAGDGVSYGHTWVADRDTTLALLPIGYADGVFRTLSGRIDVLINGRLRPNVGRICMDQFVVDLGPGAADVSEGDEAILFGPGTDGEPTAQDWADLLGTIHYEVVTSPRGRVARTYRGAPETAATLSDNDSKQSRRKSNAGLVGGCRGPGGGRHHRRGDRRAVDGPTHHERRPLRR